MIVRALHIRRFRSVERASLINCGSLNVLIGKNNAGKSNVLQALALAFEHLRGGEIAVPWRPPRPVDEFWDRDTRTAIQVGLEMSLPNDINIELRQRLGALHKEVSKSVEGLGGEEKISFIVSGHVKPKGAFLFVSQIALGSVDATGDVLTSSGQRLLAVPDTVAEEMWRFHQDSTVLQDDIESLESIRRSQRQLSAVVASDPERADMRNYYVRDFLEPFSGRPETHEEISALLRTAKSVQEVSSGLDDIAAKIRSKIASIQAQNTEGELTTYGGQARRPPDVRFVAHEGGCGRQGSTSSRDQEGNRTEGRRRIAAPQSASTGP